MTQTERPSNIRVLLRSTKRGYVVRQTPQSPFTFTDNRELAHVFETYESLGSYVSDFEYIPNEGLIAEDLDRE
jgi:hypothetical protein